MPDRSAPPAADPAAYSAAYPAVVPVLTDGTVTLRAHRRADVPAIVEQCTDPDMTAWTTVPRPYRKADALRHLALVKQAWLDPAGDRCWAIEWAGDDGVARYAGSVDLRPTPGRVAALGYGLHPDARGEGLMARAVRLVLGYAFTEGLGDGPLERVHWSAMVGNFDSWRVAWACGFVHHGSVPQLGPPQPDGRGGIVVRDHWLGSIAPGAAMAPVHPWLDIPILEADGVRLRPWRESDADRTESIGNPAHHMPLGAAPDDLTFDHWLLTRRERAARGEGITWCVADAASDDPLGAVMVFAHGMPISEPGAELGYFLFPSARGRGVATTAGRLAIEHAFTPRHDDGLGLSRLSAVTAADNAASNAVLTRLRFRRWGTEHRTDRLPDGTWENAVHWELLRPV